MTNLCRYCHQVIDKKGLRAGAEICFNCTASGVGELTARCAQLAAALEAVLGHADLESADGNDDVQRCVVCRTEYDMEDLLDIEDETQFHCTNPKCAAGNARRLLKELV